MSDRHYLYCDACEIEAELSNNAISVKGARPSSDNVDLLVGRFQHLPMANEEPAHPLASYYCDECGEPDWTDTHQGGDIREFYADEERGDTICEPCARLRAANAGVDRQEKAK